MNFRGAAVRAGGRRSANWGIWGILIVYVLIGAVISAAVKVISLPMFYFLLMHGITFTMVGMAALVESGQILFNPSEEDVLGALPLSPKTLVAAKLMNLAGFTFALALAFNAVPMFVALLYPVAWWTPLTHCLTLALHCLLCCGMVVLLYGVVAKLAGRERFESFVSSMQVAMSVFFIVGFQLMGPMMRQFHEVDPQSLPVLWLLPPRWFAALDVVLSGAPAGASDSIGALWAVTASILAFWAGVTRLSEGRERQAALSAEIRRKRETAPAPVKFSRIRSASPLAPWLRWWMSDPAEAGAFQLAAAYLRRDREIQRRLVPSMSMTVLLPLVFVFNTHGSQTASVESLFYVYMCLWMLLTLPLSALQTLRMSKDWQAAELFRFSPLENGAALFLGARKAALYYIAFPCLFAAGGLLAIVAQDPLQTLRIALPALIPLPAFSLVAGMTGGYLPLSEQPRAGEQSRKTQGIFTMMMFSAAALLFVVHQAAKAIGYYPLIAIEIPALALVQWAALRKLHSAPAIRLEP